MVTFIDLASEPGVWSVCSIASWIVYMVIRSKRAVPVRRSERRLFVLGLLANLLFIQFTVQSGFKVSGLEACRQAFAAFVMLAHCVLCCDTSGVCVCGM